MRSSRWLSLVLLLLVSLPTVAEVKLPAIIGDNMVLQRDQPLPIWGWDNPDQEVSVKLGDASATAKADSDGKWTVKLPAMKAGGPHTLTVDGSNSVKVANVLVGEVWLCSGQSNMEWPVTRANNPQEEIAAAKHPNIRHIKIRHVPADKPQTEVPSDGWKVCSPETVGSFTAVGYFFGRHLQQELDVPIGLIGSNWGGTRIEPWTPPVGFKSVKGLEKLADTEKYPEKRPNNTINHQSAQALYNGMINPLVPYGIQGAIWYQGESNNGEGMLYHEKKKALVAGWRSLWSNDEMPFYYVQLAPFRYRNREPQLLAGIWEAQLASLSIPNTGMAVTVDIGNTGDIHPKNKQDVGKRLALWALAKNYGKDDLVYSGPLYKSHKVEGNTIRVSFDHVGGGLVSRDGKELSWFEIASEDGKFVEATAKIDGNTVVVSGVDKPTAARLGWSDTAEPNLSNKDGLPASPFRTK